LLNRVPPLRESGAARDVFRGGCQAFGRMHNANRKFAAHSDAATQPGPA
jgi:hypothetical protein